MSPSVPPRLAPHHVIAETTLPVATLPLGRPPMKVGNDWGRTRLTLTGRTVAASTTSASSLLACLSASQSPSSFCEVAAATLGLLSKPLPREKLSNCCHDLTHQRLPPILLHLPYVGSGAQFRGNGRFGPNCHWHWAYLLAS